MTIFRVIAVIYDKKLKPETELPARSAIKEIGNYPFIAIKENPTELYKGIDAAIIYGGDGFLLKVANEVKQYDIPIIGVNYGRVGYLCKIKPISKVDICAIFDIIDDLHDNKLYIDNRTRISAEINGKVVADALNEISIGGINRTVYLDLSFGSNKSYNLKSIGDGIIFSTRTGSTAYNVNAGGSVIFDDNVFSILANNSIFQSNNLPVNTKSIITSSNEVFMVKIANKNKDNIPYLVADGQRTIVLDKDDTIIIKKSQYVTKFIVL